MTRKDFELIARTLSECREDLDNTTKDQLVLDTCDYIASRMATELATTNPNFDRACFLDACKKEGR